MRGYESEKSVGIEMFEFFVNPKRNVWDLIEVGADQDPCAFRLGPATHLKI